MNTRYVARPDAPGRRYMVRELPAGDRPVCRLQRHGAAVLNTAEVLSVVLNTPDAVALAEELLVRSPALAAAPQRRCKCRRTTGPVPGCHD